MAFHRISIAFVILLLMPAQALQMHEMRPEGQVVIATKAMIDDGPVGLLLAIDRGVEEAPRSALVVIPGLDQSNWRLIDLQEAPGAMAVGDVTGDGQDEVAITHNFAGEACPFPVVGQMPCGVVRIYDGPALLRGSLQLVGEVAITPQPGPCQPTNSAPASLSLSDVTGDGRAELALGQLGLLAGSCGVVHVIPGHLLSGKAGLGDACARIHGPVVRENHAPDQFGIVTRLYTSDEEPVLAVSSPHADSPDAAVTGRVATYSMREACGGSTLEPPLLAERHGAVEGQMLGADLLHAEGLLWASGKEGALVMDPVTLEVANFFAVPRSYPLSDAGDVTGDGHSEILMGHLVVTAGGELVMNLSHFAEQNFRGVVLSSDHILAADDFGTRIWSLNDLKSPYIELDVEPERINVGGFANVSIEKFIRVVDIAGRPEWSVTGGTVVESGPTWIKIRADAPGHIVAQFNVGEHSAMVSIPVDASEGGAQLTGPGTVSTMQPFTLRVSTPPGATVSWQAPEASPTSHTGPTYRAHYRSVGQYEVKAEVSFADGSNSTLVHRMDVVKSILDVLAPGAIAQGEDLHLAVADPDPGLTYLWHLEGDRMGPLNAGGPSITVPSAGWGPVEVTVSARSSEGNLVAVGQSLVDVENLPPQIQALRVHTGFDVRGLQAILTASDPGGDPVQITWYVDGQQVGQGTTLSLPDATPGRIRLSVTVQDGAGAEVSTSRDVEVPERWKIKVVEDPVGQDLHGGLDETPAGKKGIPLPGTFWVLGVLLLVVGLKRRQ